MTTEYRRGIPSCEYIEAATRLGLLWRASHNIDYFWRFDSSGRSIYDDRLSLVRSARLTPICSDEQTYLYRPIRPDGTPVDWEVLDQEVARAGQQGQAQSFRADLWRRICRHFISADEDRVSSRHLSDVETIERRGCLFRDGDGWQWLEDGGPTRADILTRWTVYQELKPLYDIVDGAQGEVAMPRDVIRAWWDRAPPTDCGNDHCPWSLHRESTGLVAQGPYRIHAGNARGAALANALRNFATVLDAVAEARVQGQAQPVPVGTLMMQNPDGTVSPARPGQQPIGRLIESTGDSPRTVAQPATPEPRRFADVRPDRHGWRWWRVYGYGEDGARIECRNDNHFRWFGRGWVPWPLQSFVWPDRTVIPTDEQGNPVSWEAAGFAAEALRSAQETVQRAASDATPARSVDDIIVDPTTGMVRSAHTVRIESPTPPRPGPLPRFTADELDDVDHSKTTKLDEVTLRRGKLPTVEQIAKYREVRARRTGGAVADALKESRIDCEVAQYVLERWAGGLGDANVLAVIEEVRFLDCAVDVDKRAAWFIGLTCGATLDTSEKPSPTAQRERQEAEERRQRLAELRQRLVAERAAQPPEMAKVGEVSRFDLIEPDPQADPVASIRAWEARQAAAKVLPAAVPPRIVKPVAAQHRPAIEVVDAEADGLSRSDIVAALVGRAFNGGC